MRANLVNCCSKWMVGFEKNIWLQVRVVPNNYSSQGFAGSPTLSAVLLLFHLPPLQRSLQELDTFTFRVLCQVSR